MSRVAVLGAGIAGLTAGYGLATAGVDVTVFERSGRIGGKLRTTPMPEVDGLEGVVVEEGADAFLVRQPEAVEVAGKVGAVVVHPETGVAQVFCGGRLRTLPARTMLGVPGSLRGLSDVLTAKGAARAALDRVLPSHSYDGDPTVGDLVRRRLGSEVLDRMVDPLLGGVYAGTADDLSVAATLPALLNPGRSLLHTVADRLPAPVDGPVFGSVAGGMEVLAVAVAEAIRAAGGSIATGRTVTALSRTGTTWTVATQAGATTSTETFDAVVLALPAASAARLIDPHVPPAVVPTTPYASVALVTLVYPAATPVPAGNGFLVAASERRVVKAVTFVGNKWQHPPGAPVVLRASVGRYGDVAELQRPDVELAGVVAADIASLTGISARPMHCRVTRWGGALPQYQPGHVERVGALRAALPAGLAVCGAAYDGVGIPSCVRSGTAAARSVLGQLGG